MHVVHWLNMQARYSDTVLAVRALAVDVDSCTEHVHGQWEGKQVLLLQLTGGKAWVGLQLGPLCSGNWNLKKLYENIPPTHFEYPLPAYSQNSLLLFIASGWVHAREPCVVGGDPWYVSLQSKLKSWTLLKACLKTGLYFVFDVGRDPRTSWFRRMPLVP